MNDFGMWYSGDNLFKRVLIGVSLAAIMFAIYVATY